jgi:L-ascorbate peroxidase
MHSAALKIAATKPFQVASTASRSDRRRVKVSCVASPDQPDRRGLLAGLAGSLAVLPFINPAPAHAMKDKLVAGKNLSSFQKKDLLQDFQKRAEAEIKKVVTGADAPLAMRLLFNDASTYDAVARTGGVNGSVVLSEELKRPENKDLKDLVDRLGAARKAIAEAGPASQKTISWADTIVLACKVTQQMIWYDARFVRNPVNGALLAESYGNPITVRLGRLDSETPDAAGKVLAVGASAQDVLALSKTLGVKDPEESKGPFSKKAPFWERIMYVLWCATQPDPAAAEAALATGAPEAFAEFKDKYDKSKASNFRTDYEIDFNDYLNKLANLGAKFDNDAYLYDVIFRVPDKY